MCLPVRIEFTNCFVILYYIILYYIILYYIILYYIILYYIISYILYYIISYHISSHITYYIMFHYIIFIILHYIIFFIIFIMFHNWCNKGRGMCYPVCGMVRIKEPLLLIGKSSLCGGSGFPFSLSEWSLTICLTPYNRR